jgi:glycosyltransferase involved in cell wall biosynthesis
MQPIQIVAIMLVKNEDIYIERSIRNIVDFCDKIIITDHQSTDGTFEICKRLAHEFPKIVLQSIKTPQESAAAIEPYIGTSTWVFGVDGDEIYNPQGLKLMRESLLEGAFANDWCIFGNVLNVMSLDLNKKTASGHLAPPSRSMTKIYNFSMIESWENCPERLHGEDVKFKTGFNFNLRRYLHTEIPWDQSYFQCLHMAFMKRSSLDKIRIFKTRLIPEMVLSANTEKNAALRLLRKLRLQMSLLFGLDWKNQKYRRGPLVKKDVSVFFS